MRFPYSFRLFDYIGIKIGRLHRRLSFRSIEIRIRRNYIDYIILEIPVDYTIGDDEIIRERIIARTEIAIKERLTPHKGCTLFFRTYCRYCRPSRLKTPGTRDYKFGSGNSPAIRTHKQRHEHSAVIDFTKPISSGNAQAVIASGKFTSPHFFSHFSTSFLNRHLLSRGPESFIRAARARRPSSLFLYYCRNPR